MINLNTANLAPAKIKSQVVFGYDSSEEQRETVKVIYVIVFDDCQDGLEYTSDTLEGALKFVLKGLPACSTKKVAA